MLNNLLLNGGAADEKLYVEDVFSTYLYTGTGSAQTITNGIDLSGKGGLVWIKGCSGATDHAIYDTARGATKDIATNLTTAETTQSAGLTSFGSTGFTIGALAKLNTSAATYASWTFRKAPKFFDVVTFNFDPANGLTTVNHNLGVTPGIIIVKTTNQTRNWYIGHRGTTNGFNDTLILNTTAREAANNGNFANVTSTSFKVDIGGTAGVTQNCVAYLFAHDTTADGIVQCGSYTGNGSASGPTVTLGWEPQYVMIKMSSSTGDWQIFDNMRGIPTGSSDPYLFANTSAAETTNNGDLIDLTPTGFTIKSTNAQVNTNAGTYVYMAIRRGPMRTPTDATKVYYVETVAQTGIQQTTNSPISPDLVATSSRAGAGYYFETADRLRGLGTPTDTYSSSSPNLSFASSAAEGTAYIQQKANGRDITKGSGWNSTAYGGFAYYLFKRAPSFFDAVCYTGTGAARTVSHNLGAAPELIIIKNRTSSSNWIVYCATEGVAKYLMLNSTIAAASDAPTIWNNTLPTSTAFSLGAISSVNASGGFNYVAYLFASCPGVSKVGSYTGTGASQSINCGFSNGARFVLVKRTDSTGDWYLWDTARGIIAGNDPYFLLNLAAAETTGTDYIDPYAAGFQLSSTAPAALNASGGTFIYLAIA